MASRRRPPPQPSRVPKGPVEAPADAAERTVISQMPVFDDEAPTPVPDPPKPRAPRPASKPAPRAKAPAPRAKATAAPRASASSSRAPSKPRPSKPAPAREGSLGAAPPPSAPPVPREATFVGLPVGLGAPAAPAEPAPAGPTAPAPASPPRVPTPSPEQGLKITPARPRAPAVEVSPAAARGSSVSVSAAPSAPRSPSASVSAAPPARAPKLTLPKPGGAPQGGLQLPPVEAPAAPVSGSTPAPTPTPPAARPADNLPLGFDEIASKGPGPAPAAGSTEPGPGRLLVLAAVLTVVGVASVFVTSGDDAPTAVASAPAPKTSPAVAKGAQAEAPRMLRTTGARRTSAQARAAGRKRPGAAIARRQARAPAWTSARVAALQAPGSKPPVMGGEAHPHQDHNRDYLKEDDGPKAPMLMIFTQPPGMTIEVKGALYGRTPMVRPLYGELDRLDVRLSGVGYEDKKLTLRPDKDGSIRFNGVMTPRPQQQP